MKVLLVISTYHASWSLVKIWSNTNRNSKVTKVHTCEIVDALSETVHNAHTTSLVGTQRIIQIRNPNNVHLTDHAFIFRLELLGSTTHYSYAFRIHYVQHAFSRLTSSVQTFPAHTSMTRTQPQDVCRMPHNSLKNWLTPEC